MNKKYVWSVPLPAETVARIRATWHECLGDPVPLGSGMFATVSFKDGRLRIMAMHPGETSVVRKALNQVSMQSELVDLDKEPK